MINTCNIIVLIHYSHSWYYQYSHHHSLIHNPHSWYYQYSHHSFNPPFIIWKTSASIIIDASPVPLISIINTQRYHYHPFTPSMTLIVHHWIHKHVGALQCSWFSLKKLVFWTLTSDYDYHYHTITPSIWRLSLTIDFIIILEHYSADDFPHNDFSPDDFPHKN